MSTFDEKTSAGKQDNKRIVALGPFKSLDYDAEKGKVVVVYAPPAGFTVSKKTVYLNPDGILKIFEGPEGLYYVLYETDNADSYAEYLTPRIEGTELNKLTFSHYQCGNRILDSDIVYEHIREEGCYRCPDGSCAKKVIEYEYKPKNVNMNKVIFGRPELTIEDDTAFIHYGITPGNNTKFIFFETPQVSSIKIYKTPVTVERGRALVISYPYDQGPKEYIGLVEKYTAQTNGRKIVGYKILKEFTREEIEKLLPELQKLDYNERSDVVEYLVKKGYNDLAEKVAGNDVYMLYRADPKKYADKYAEYLAEHPEEGGPFRLIELHDFMKKGFVNKEIFDRAVKAYAEYLINNLNKKSTLRSSVLDTLKLLNPNDNVFKDLVNTYINYLINNPKEIGVNDIIQLGNYAEPKEFEKLVTKYIEMLEKDKERLNILRKYKDDADALISELEKKVKDDLLPEQLVNKLKSLIEGNADLTPLLKEFEQAGIKVRINREGNKIYVIPGAYMERTKFNKYVEILKKNGFKFQPSEKTWYKEL